MEETLKDVEQKIIVATTEAIAQFGIEGATTRKIAELAQVNIASINYYFRTKESLIHRALEASLENAFDLSNVGRVPGESLEDRCVGIFSFMFEASLTLPGLVKAHLASLIYPSGLNPSMVPYVQRFHQNLWVELRNENPGGSDLETSLQNLIAFFLMMMISPSLFRNLGNVSLGGADRGALVRAFQADFRPLVRSQLA